MTDESNRPTKTVTLAHEDRDSIEDALEAVRNIPGMAVWENDEPRTTIVKNGEIDEIHVEGIGDNDTGPQRVAIDYATEPPQVIVHGDPRDEEPTNVVSLEHADSDDPPGDSDR